MGLLSLAKFSSQPTLKDKVSKRTQQRESVASQISSDFIQFLINNGIRRLLFGEAVSETLLIYTVPAGKRFYVTSANLDFLNDDTVARSSFILIAGTQVLTITAPATNGINNSSINFQTPIIVNPSETIQIRNTFSAGGARGSVQGYQLDFREEKQRY